MRERCVVVVVVLGAQSLIIVNRSFFSHCEQQSGYAGVATYVRKGLIRAGAEAVVVGFGMAEAREFDTSGRVLCTDHGEFVLINCYFPNTGRGTDECFECRKRFQRFVTQRCRALIASGRRVVLIGDLNVVNLDIDHFDPMVGLLWRASVAHVLDS